MTYSTIQDGVNTTRTVLFIQNTHFESLGLEYLSSTLKQHGFDTELFFFDGDVKKLLQYLRQKPDVFLIGLSLFSYQHGWATELIKEIINMSNIPIVVGGGHPTFFPEESILMVGVDFIVRGEGEFPLLNLCRTLTSVKKDIHIPGVWAKNADGTIVRNEMARLPDSLDAYPFPDRSLYRKSAFSHFPVKRFITRRGCPHNCSFCFNKQYKQMMRGKGKTVRIRTPDNVIEEILQVKAHYGMKTVAFTDDDFTSNRTWCLEFLGKYRKNIGLPFSAFGKASEMDDELVRTLKASGCHMIAIGVETANERVRNNIFKKKLSNNQIFAAARLFHLHRLNFTTFNILANPEEGFIDAVHTLKFNVALRPSTSVATVLNPYRETDIYNYCLEKNLIDKKTQRMLEEEANVFGYTAFLNQPEMREMISLSKLFTMLVRLPWLIRPAEWLIKHDLLPRPMLAICYYISSALRQKIKLKLNWFEFITLGIKIGKDLY